MPADGSSITFVQTFDLPLNLPEQVWRDLFDEASRHLGVKGADLIAASGRNAIIHFQVFPGPALFNRLRVIWTELLRKHQEDVSANGPSNRELILLAEEISRRWSQEPDLAPLFASGLADKAAFLAALRIIPERSSSGEMAPLPVVDPASGLPLPPPLRTPYQSRGHGPDGKRRDIVGHLQHEYADYISAGLFTTGFLFDQDRPAYNALNYKAVRAIEESTGQRSVSDWCLQLGILTRDHLSNPPRKYRRQVELLKRAQAVQQLLKLVTRTS